MKSGFQRKSASGHTYTRYLGFHLLQKKNIIKINKEYFYKFFVPKNQQKIKNLDFRLFHVSFLAAVCAHVPRDTYSLFS